MNTIAISIGAIIGALSRYYLTEFVTSIFGENSAYQATFFLNITGCFLIAYILTWSQEKNPFISPRWLLLSTTGFCGSYTTFSTYGLEIYNFLQKNNLKLAFNYGFGSMVLGLLAIYLGVILARSGRARRNS